MDDKWIDSIRDKMVGYDVVPPAGLLESIQKEVRAKRIRKRLLFTAIAACIALLVSVSLTFIPEVEKGKMPEVSVINLKETGKKDKVSLSVIAETVVHESAARSMSQSSAGMPPVSAMSDMDSETTQTSELTEPDGHICKPHERIERKLDSFDDVDDFTPIAYHTKKRLPLSVGVATSANGLGGMFEDADLNGRPSHTSMPFTRMGGGLLTNSPIINYTPPTFIELFNHKLPVRFSIDFSWPITHHLEVVTGICYSYLRSDIRYGYSDSKIFKATQNLHFIGIPANLRYIPWNFRNFDIYVSGGFMAEKCIGGQIKEESSAGYSYRYKGCDDRPFQFSFNAAAGLQYGIAHKYAVFIEPGIGVYFKNGSRLRTIYSERPLTFNVNVGLRFSY